MSKIKVSDIDASGTPSATTYLRGDGAWQTPAGGGGGANWWFSPPTAASFSLMNSDGTDLTLTDDSDAGLMVTSNAPVSASGTQTRAAYRTLTNGALAWDFAIKMPAWLPNVNFSGVGIGVYNSTNNRSLRINHQNNTFFGIDRFSALGTFSSAVITPGAFPGNVIQWYRMTFDGTTYRTYMSDNGKNWVFIYSETAAAYVTATGGIGNRVMFHHQITRTTGAQQVSTVEYFSLTGPAV
jgi:hypothetical protein